ncbi:unnamed protein product, partial [Gongylonema pulchrum]|uniref:WD_REPEATS_REGION domain-containing protein n=1 Tax=Gongylonema pulchrum TaxID=637853 RepID=A0A183D1I9_9BILA
MRILNVKSRWHKFGVTGADYGEAIDGEWCSMQLTNPVWIHHSGGAIYSVDIHPNGTKIATCGQGGEGGSGLVIIWNVKPVINEKASQDATCNRLLSRILHQ